MIRIKGRTPFASKMLIALVLALLAIFNNPLTAYADARDDLVGVWQGTYARNASLTLVVFRNGSRYEAVFNFNNGGRIGSYMMDVTHSNGVFSLNGTTWIERPSNFVFVNLSGTISGNVFSGGSGTSAFNVTRIHHNPYRYTGPHDHHGAETVRDATCINDGEVALDCIICGEIIRTILPRAGHTPGDWATLSEPTCTDTGQREQRCTVCNDVVSTEQIPALGHALSGEWVVRREPTCIEAGERVQYCTRINSAVLNEQIAMLPHIPYGDWFVASEPTCSVEGVEVRSCELCGGEAVTRPITRLPHTPSGNWVVYEEPTCNTAGRRVQYCTICGNVAIDEVIPAITGLDHVLIAERISGNTFIPPIVTQYTCEVCDYDGGNTTSWALAWVSPGIVVGTSALAISVFKVKKRIKKGKKFVCPYCFEEHLVQDVQFRCANTRCVDVDDVELTIYEGGDASIPIKAKQTFAAPPSRNYDTPKYAKCPDCGRESSKVICPSCHNNLPESSLIGEDMIISIVGSRDVGKSHFIGVIINELIERVAGRFEGALTGFDNTMTRYEANFGRNLYVELTKLELTQSSTVNTNNGAYKPYIYTLSVNKNNKVKNYTLVFFDTAGEDLNEFDTMNTVNRYICKSAGISWPLLFSPKLQTVPS